MDIHIEGPLDTLRQSLLAAQFADWGQSEDGDDVCEEYTDHDGQSQCDVVLQGELLDFLLVFLNVLILEPERDGRDDHRSDDKSEDEYDVVYAFEDHDSMLLVRQGQHPCTEPEDERLDQSVPAHSREDQSRYGP